MRVVNRWMEETDDIREVKISLRGGKRSEGMQTEGRLKVKEQREL